MVWTTIALVMTVLMGGIIAYNGDLIGRKFGKRRVSLFGLRPKYTAILITSLTGVMISAITTGVLFLLVPQVRSVILEGEIAIRDNVHLKAEKIRIEKETRLRLAKSQQEIAQAESQKINAQNDMKQAQAYSRNAKAQLESLQNRLETVRTEIAVNKRQVADLRQEKAALQAQNTALHGKNQILVKINEALAEQILVLSRQKDQLTRDVAQKIKYNNALAKANEEYSKQNLDLVRETLSLTKQKETLAKENEDLQKQTDVLKRVASQIQQASSILKGENERLQKENTHLASENRDLSELVKQIAPNYRSLREAYWASRMRRVIVHKDEDLARKVIPANSPPESIREIIQQLLYEAGQIAVSRGAGAGDQARAVQVVDREFITKTSSGQIETVKVSAGDRIDAVVSRLAWQPAPVCVLAIAVNNTVEDEPAAVDLQNYTNRLIYTKGQVVSARWLNGNQPLERIFADVVVFLKEMGQGALEKGMIPRMDPLTGEPQVGAMGGLELVQLVDRVRETGGRVRLRAVASNDTHSADPLLLEFKVER